MELSFIETDELYRFNWDAFGVRLKTYRSCGCGFSRIWTRSVQEAADKRSAFKHLESLKWEASHYYVVSSRVEKLKYIPFENNFRHYT